MWKLWSSTTIKTHVHTVNFLFFGPRNEATSGGMTQHSQEVSSIIFPFLDVTLMIKVPRPSTTTRDGMLGRDMRKVAIFNLLYVKTMSKIYMRLMTNW